MEVELSAMGSRWGGRCSSERALETLSRYKYERQKFERSHELAQFGAGMAGRGPSRAGLLDGGPEKFVRCHSVKLRNGTGLCDKKEFDRVALAEERIEKSFRHSSFPSELPAYDA